MKIYGWQNNSSVAFGILIKNILQFNMHSDNLRFIGCEELLKCGTLLAVGSNAQAVTQ